MYLHGGMTYNFDTGGALICQLLEPLLFVVSQLTVCTCLLCSERNIRGAVGPIVDKRDSRARNNR
jgi:hypothetical protein